jgi:hypothetical protein
LEIEVTMAGVAEVSALRMVAGKMPAELSRLWIQKGIALLVDSAPQPDRYGA